MDTRILKSWLAAGGALLALGGVARAGGFDRGGVNIDLLFDDRPYAVEAGVTYVSPQRELHNVRRLDGSGLFSYTVGTDADYAFPRLGLKANIVGPVDCLATYQQPDGIDVDYGLNNAYSPTAVKFKVDTDDYGLTCAFRFDVGPGFAGAIGGVSYQQVDALQSRQTLLPTVFRNPGVGVFRLSDDTVSWRAGASYEIPNIGFRASLVYSARYDYDGLSGTVDTTGFAVGSTGPSNGRFLGVYPVTASTEVPQALDLKLQTGIAPGWLVFGSVRWQQWSRLQVIPINGVVSPVTGTISTTTSFDPFYQDGWTVSGGIGHAFTDKLSAALSLTWDRGTSTVSGYQSDLWSVSAGGSFKATDNVELRLGGSLGLWASGTSGIPPNGDPASRITYSFDNDLVAAISGSVKVHW